MSQKQKPQKIMSEFIKYFLMFIFTMALGLNIFFQHEEAKSKGFSEGVDYAIGNLAKTTARRDSSYTARRKALDSMFNVCKAIKIRLEKTEWERRKK